MSYLPKFLLLLLLQLYAFPSIACSTRPGYTPPATPELFKEAKTVFTAHVYRTEEKSGSKSTDETQFTILEGEFRVIEVLKGTPPADNKIKAALLPCGGVLIPSFDYIFFVRDGQEIVSWDYGSRALESLNSTFLETLRKLAKSPP